MTRIAVSAQMICYINGRLFGAVTSIQWHSLTPHRTIPQLDCLQAAELAPVATKTVGSLQVMRLRGEGGLEGRGIVAPYTHIEREQYFTIAILNRLTDETYFRADYCKVTDQTWIINAKQRLEGSFTFEALDGLATEAEYPG